MKERWVEISIRAKSTDDLIDIAPAIQIAVEEGNGGTLSEITVTAREITE